MIFSAVALAATMVASAGNFGMSISPAEVTGPSHSHASFVITDTGKTILKIRIELAELRPIAGHPDNWTSYGDFREAKVSEEGFTLKPGDKKRIVVTVNATDKYRHDVGIAAVAQPGGINSGASISTATVARFVVNPNGQQSPQTGPIVAESPAEPGGFPTWMIPLGGFVLALAVIVAFRLRRTKGSREYRA